MPSPAKKILLISYYFPPMGMGGVGRPLALFKYLPRYGYDATVLTVKNILYPEYDYSLLDGLDEQKIMRTGSYDPSRLLYLLGVRNMELPAFSLKKARTLYFPDSRIGWNRKAIIQARKILKTGDYSAIITTSPPPSTHLIGLQLKSETGIPWIADFRDLWFSLPIEEIYQRPGQRERALRMKSEIVRECNEAIAVNSDIKTYLGRGEIITNGADLENLDWWRKPVDSTGSKFIIGILGTVNQLCPVEPLFAAIRKLKDKNPSIGDSIRVVHVGQFDRKMMAEDVARYDLRKVIELKGYLPRKAAIETLCRANILYLSVGKFGGHNILPGRIFDYLISGKPILGVVPDDSDAASLLRDYELGIAISIENISGLVVDLERMIHNWQSETTHLEVEPEKLLKYSSTVLAQKYAAVLDRIIK